MPMQYIEPTGSKKIEFWCRGRGAEKSLMTQVPEDWDEDDIKYELEDWSSQYFPTSEFVSYGWNDQYNFGSRK